MILYNVTINIDDSIHDEWLQWMQKEHVPSVLGTGLFVDNKILRLLTEIDNGGTTYSFQYFLQSMEDFIIYQNEHADRLQAEQYTRYADRFVTFETVLEVVD